MRPTNIFAAAATPAKWILDLSLFVLSVTTLIFLVVFALLAHSVIKVTRKQDDDCEPLQVYGSNYAELEWTVIPVLIVITLFFSTAPVEDDRQLDSIRQVGKAERNSSGRGISRTK